MSKISASIYSYKLHSYKKENIRNVHENRKKTGIREVTYELFFPQVSPLQRHPQVALGISDLGRRHR